MGRDHRYNVNCGCGYCERETMRRSQRGSSSDRWELQDESPDAKVFVHGGFTKDPSRPDYHGRTDIRIVDKTGGKVSRIHKSYSREDGTESDW